MDQVKIKTHHEHILNFSSHFVGCHKVDFYEQILNHFTVKDHFNIGLGLDSFLALGTNILLVKDVLYTNSIELTARIPNTFYIYFYIESHFVVFLETWGCELTFFL